MDAVHRIETAVAEQIVGLARVEKTVADLQSRPAVAADPETREAVKGAMATLIAQSRVQQARMQDVLTVLQSVPAASALVAAVTQGAENATSQRLSAVAMSLEQAVENVGNLAIFAAEMASKADAAVVRTEAAATRADAILRSVENGYPTLGGTSFAVVSAMLLMCLIGWGGWVAGKSARDSEVAAAVATAKEETRQQLTTEMEAAKKAAKADLDDAKALNDKTSDTVRWANTPAGRQARALDKIGTLDRIANCTEPGWQLREQDGRRVCYPNPPGQTRDPYGWFLD